jgi:hypothetical protein
MVGILRFQLFQDIGGLDLLGIGLVDRVGRFEVQVDLSAPDGLSLSNPIILTVHSTALGTVGWIVCEAALSTRISPGEAWNQLSESSGPADGVDLGQVVVSASVPLGGVPESFR